MSCGQSVHDRTERSARRASPVRKRDGGSRRRMVVVAAAAWMAAAPTRGAVHVFDTPSDDRWHYPFNFTPATRPIATCFSSVGNVTFPTFNDRDGYLIVAWNTAALIPAGECPEKYRIQSIRVTATNASDARWLIDTTLDEWFTYDFDNDGSLNADGVPRGQPGDTDGESNDGDPGRPVELFGAGFGPNHSYNDWTEAGFYVGADQFTNDPRDPFPFVFQEQTGALLHVEDSVKGTQNETADPPVTRFTPTPWAIGLPVDYEPDNQPVPFDVIFNLNLDESGGLVRRYFQEQLSGGRVFVAITSLLETVQFGGDPGALPAFFNKEGLNLDPGAKAPRLEIVLAESLLGNVDDDCDVDLVDHRALAQCLGAPGARPDPPPPLLPEYCLYAFDFDADDDVDIRDVRAFFQVFTGPG